MRNILQKLISPDLLHILLEYIPEIFWSYKDDNVLV